MCSSDLFPSHDMFSATVHSDFTLSNIQLCRILSCSWSSFFPAIMFCIVNCFTSVSIHAVLSAFASASAAFASFNLTWLFAIISPSMSPALLLNGLVPQVPSPPDGAVPPNCPPAPACPYISAGFNPAFFICCTCAG